MQNKPSIDKEAIRRHLADSSHKLALLTAEMALENSNLLRQLTEFSLGEIDPFAQRASRVVSMCFERYPELLPPLKKRILTRIGRLRSVGALRNYLKVFAEVPVYLTPGETGQLAETCFNLLADDKQPVAIRVYSMQVIYNITIHLPDLVPEFRALLEDGLDEGSAGYKSRALKILKKLPHS